jgi:hypothetical protein
VALGAEHTCALRADNHAIECWGGTEQFHQSTPPAGAFQSLTADIDRTCALDGAGALHCWGDVSFGDEPF